MRSYKVEGNIVFPDYHMLTWGPFYYHDKEKAKAKIPDILEHIVGWVNEKDPSLEIKPESVVSTKSGDTLAFTIKAWKTEKELQECNGLVQVTSFSYEDTIEL